MTHDAILACCLQNPGAYEDRPFGPDNLVVKVRGKIFAHLYGAADRPKATFNCEEIDGDAYRALYPQCVMPTSYCPPEQQPFFLTVDLRCMPDDALRHIIGRAYDRVVSRLPKYVQKELAQDTGGEAAQ